MLTFINNFIGTSYEADPFGYFVAVLFTIWLLSTLNTIIFNLFGISK